MQTLKKKVNLKLVFGAFVAIMFILPTFAGFLSAPQTTGSAVNTLGARVIGSAQGGFNKTAEAPLFENKTLVVLYYGQSTCEHCQWQRPILEEIAQENENITLRAYDFDKIAPQGADLNRFNTFNPGQYIPLVIIGNVYFRAGSGEAYGAEVDKAAIQTLINELLATRA